MTIIYIFQFNSKKIDWHDYKKIQRDKEQSGMTHFLISSLICLQLRYRKK